MKYGDLKSLCIMALKGYIKELSGTVVPLDKTLKKIRLLLDFLESLDVALDDE